MDPVSAFPLLLVAAMPSRTRRSMIVLFAGLVLAAVFNLPWLVQQLQISEAMPQRLIDLATNPTVMLVANAAAGLMIVWGLVQLLFAGSPRQRLVSTLIGRGDFLGAAQIYAQDGNLKKALSLYVKAKAWSEAASTALELGRDHQAADFLRRAGGHDLGEAARLFRRTGDIGSAQRCDRDFAEWLTSRGRYDEAVEAWMRAGDPKRAAGSAIIALEEGRLSSSHPSLPVARRAVEQVGDHRVLARLHEVEGNWLAAAHAWRSAGDHSRAAEIFRKAGMMHDAAVAESAAGHPREAALLRIRQLKAMRDRLSLRESRNDAPESEIEDLRRSIKREEESLIPLLSELEMRQEMVDVISASGRAEEAIAKLVQQNEESEAADLAINAELWHLAAPILERLGRWGEASDIFELSGNIEAAARCAEKAGEDERALQLYRGLGIADGAAHCLARLGFLQDALAELHRDGLFAEAFEVLQSHPGPIPDIPQVVLEMAEWARSNLSPEQAIACLQRAVIGVALQPSRLAPAVALAEELHRAGERAPALAQLERILAFDYSCEAARLLRARIEDERGVDSVSTRPGTLEPGAQADLAAQQRYEILTELGRGGMGVVYKARDTRLERDVAIKVLRTTSAEEAARLGQEAKAAATLNHPGIVTIHDFEMGFDGYFIAMEFVPGKSLDELVKKHPSKIRTQLASILLRLADAMAYAHSHHVIHRDLKPGNILLTPEYEVKILDFGIAARLDQGASSGPSICGTPFYMAPEQIRGKSPTPATDIYAFGATAFHLATGRPPFHTGNIIDSHLKVAAPNPLDLTPDLDPDLGKIILRCLEKKPEDRFADSVELHTALQTIRS